MAKNKIRLDQLLVERELAETRSKAQALILAGSVRVAGAQRTKAGEMIAADAEIEIAAALPYASRGGYKLAHALDTFALDPAGLVALDAGASTGGFTHVLLQRDAALVYAVDVGYGIIDWRLRQDPRVIMIERTNIRYLEALPGGEGQEQRTKNKEQRTENQEPENRRTGEPENRRTGEPENQEPRTGEPENRRTKNPEPENRRTGEPRTGEPENPEPGDQETEQSTIYNLQSAILADCATIDVSFISLRLVLPAVRRLLTPDAWIVALIKPQFEAGATQVGKGGVVRDPSIHAAVLREVLQFAINCGLTPHGLTRSPITGPAGNVEFLAWLGGPGPELALEQAIKAVL